MKPTMTVFVCVLAAGMAAAQGPLSVIQNTRDTMNGVRDNSAAASNAALGLNQQAPASVASAPAASNGSLIQASASGPAKSASKVGVRPGHLHKSSASKGAPAAAKRVPAAFPVAAAAPGAAAPEAADATKPAEDGAVDNKWSGKRDPFISPVVSHAGITSCMTGKKCLEIGAINLRGIVHSGDGFIAVVSNSLNKAYFLKEHDPVFNGYVVKITGDSIVFEETVQDRLGKTFTREVVKKITTPAV